MEQNEINNEDLSKEAKEKEIEKIKEKTVTKKSGGKTTRKCMICGCQKEKEDMVSVNKRFCCSECFEIKEKHAKEYKDLIKFICDLFCIDAPTGQMVSQISSYQQKYGYKYAGMKMTLDYFYNTLDNGIPETNSLGIIPSMYEEAKKAYIAEKEKEAKLTDQKKKEYIKSLDFQQSNTININREDIIKYREEVENSIKSRINILELENIELTPDELLLISENSESEEGLDG